MSLAYAYMQAMEPHVSYTAAADSLPCSEPDEHRIRELETVLAVLHKQRNLDWREI